MSQWKALTQTNELLSRRASLDCLLVAVLVKNPQVLQGSIEVLTAHFYHDEALMPVTSCSIQYPANIHSCSMASSGPFVLFRGEFEACPLAMIDSITDGSKADIRRGISIPAR